LLKRTWLILDFAFHSSTLVFQQLYELARACEVVVCCRVAPLQKAGVVSLVKRSSGQMTLAVGDGMFDSLLEIYYILALFFEWCVNFFSKDYRPQVR